MVVHKDRLEDIEIDMDHRKGHSSESGNKVKDMKKDNRVDVVMPMET
jgi:hypothetical protein